MFPIPSSQCSTLVILHRYYCVPISSSLPPVARFESVRCDRSLCPAARAPTSCVMHAGPHCRPEDDVHLKRPKAISSRTGSLRSLLGDNGQGVGTYSITQHATLPSIVNAPKHGAINRHNKSARNGNGNGEGNENQGTGQPRPACIAGYCSVLIPCLSPPPLLLSSTSRGALRFLRDAPSRTHDTRHSTHARADYSAHDMTRRVQSARQETGQCVATVDCLPLTVRPCIVSTTLAPSDSQDLEI